MGVWCYRLVALATIHMITCHSVCLLLSTQDFVHRSDDLLSHYSIALYYLDHLSNELLLLCGRQMVSILLMNSRRCRSVYLFVVAHRWRWLLLRTVLVGCAR